MTTFLQHGSLLVGRDLETAYDCAKDYLCRDPVERGLFSRLEDSQRAFHLVRDARNDDYFDPNNDTIHWDPHSALRTTRGGTQSPALGLGHEVAHAVENPLREAQLADTPNVRYDDCEERRVIRGSEAHAARTLGEAQRWDHDGVCFRVRSPIAH